MSRSRRLSMLLLCTALFFRGEGARAESPEQLARESEERTAATALIKPTPQMIMEKVDQAVALLKKEGTVAFSKFKGKDSPFIFAGTHIWIHDEDGVMRMHPIKYGLEGKKLIGLKDSSGKKFFAVMNQKASEQGAGWVDYWWPKTGEKTASQNVSYVKGVHVDGKLLVVVCGSFDMAVQDVDTLPK
jgi:cytochrome c